MIRIGVDIGGSGMKAALVDTETGELTTERLRIDTPKKRDPKSMAKVVADLVGQLGGEGTVGLGMPSVVTGGVARTAANIAEEWIGTDAAALYGKASGRPCLVANDADVAGVAEMRYGKGRGEDGVVLLLTLGTGIGSALFVDGRLVPNTEFGHIEVRGKEGEKRAAASVRDDKALSWKAWAGRLDEYIDTLERLVWPDLIILGGGITKSADKFVPLLSTRARLTVASLLNNAGIVGAALLAASADAASQPETARRGGGARTSAPSAAPATDRSATRPAGARSSTRPSTASGGTTRAARSASASSAAGVPAASPPRRSRTAKATAPADAAPASPSPRSRSRATTAAPSAAAPAGRSRTTKATAVGDAAHAPAPRRSRAASTASAPSGETRTRPRATGDAAPAPRRSRAATPPAGDPPTSAAKAPRPSAAVRPKPAGDVPAKPAAPKREAATPKPPPRAGKASGGGRVGGSAGGAARRSG